MATVTHARPPSPLTEFDTPEIEWAWAPEDDPERSFNQVIITPVVGNMTDDNGDSIIDASDDADIVFIAAEVGGINWDLPGALVILDGSSGDEVAYFTRFEAADGTEYQPQAIGGVALGDIDADGVPEACFPTLTAPMNLCPR